MPSCASSPVLQCSNDKDNLDNTASGTGFHGSNDPNDSVKALKEVVVLRIGFDSTRSTSPCYTPTNACNNTYTNLTRQHKIPNVQFIIKSSRKVLEFDHSHNDNLL